MATYVVTLVRENDDQSLVLNNGKVVALRKSPFTNNDIIGSAVSGENGCYQFSVSAQDIYKLFIGTSLNNLTEDKSFGGDDGTFLPTENQINYFTLNGNNLILNNGYATSISAVDVKISNGSVSANINSLSSTVGNLNRFTLSSDYISATSNLQNQINNQTTTIGTVSSNLNSLSSNVGNLNRYTLTSNIGSITSGLNYKNLTSLSSTFDYSGQIGVLNSIPYIAGTNSNYIKWIGIPGLNSIYRLSNSGSNSSVQPRYSDILESVKDVSVVNSLSSKKYSLNSFRRNDAGVWLMRLWEHDGNGANLIKVAEFNTTTNPENGDRVTIHTLTAATTANISCQIALNWSKLTSGVNNYEQLWSFDGFDVNNEILGQTRAPIINSYNALINTQALSTANANFDSKFTPRLVLPARIDIATGRELNIWNDAVTVQHNPIQGITLNYKSNVGYAKNRSFRFTPSISATNTLGLSAYDRNGTLLQSKTSLLNAVSNSAGTSAVNVLFIGDSLIQSNALVPEFRSLTISGGTTANCVGTRGTYPNAQEGRGGWTTRDFATSGSNYYRFTVSGLTSLPDINSTIYSNNSSQFRVQELALTAGAGTISCDLYSGSNAPTGSGTLTKVTGNGNSTITFSSSALVAGNPFWNTSRLDFQNYMSVNSFTGGLQYAIIQLGINDIGGYTTTQSIDNLKTLIDGINNPTYGYPNCKIILGLPPIGCLTNDGWANNYGANYDKETFERGMRSLWESTISTFDLSAYNSNVRICPAGLWLDRYYGYPTTNEFVSSRKTSVSLSATLNALHPELSGYYQLADAYFSTFRALN